MTASRLGGKELSNIQWVEVQGNWMNANISDSYGGSFLAPIVWMANIGIINWLFRFTLLANNGTSQAFKLVVPELKDFPSQRCGVLHHLNVMTPVLLQPIGAPATTAEFQAGSMVLTQATQIAFRAQISPDTLNY